MDGRRGRFALIGIGLLATAGGIGLFSTAVLKQGNVDPSYHDDDTYWETYPLGEIGYWFGVALLIVTAIAGLLFLGAAAVRLGRAQAPGSPLPATALFIAGIVSTYLVFLILSQRGDMTSAVVLHAIVACCFVLFVDVAGRMAGPWAAVFVLLVTALGALWLFLAFLGLLIFGCGTEGCFA